MMKYRYSRFADAGFGDLSVSMTRNEKFSSLQDILKSMGKVLVAFSGGVDSTFLLKVAKETLRENGQRVLAVTARSASYPESEFQATLRLAGEIGAEHLVIETEELENPDYLNNPSNRCYFCKSELHGKLKEVAKQQKVDWILDGTNYDDRTDHRPGMQAARESGVRSPLLETELTKEEIRTLAREMGLPNWDKPSMPCLSSRIPYGSFITPNKLSMVERAERVLREMGFRECRVRNHDPIARIEVERSALSRILETGTLESVVRRFKEIGFLYVTVDLEGFRSGSLNEPLKKKGSII
jgi:uncharacterized protein